MFIPKIARFNETAVGVRALAVLLVATLCGSMFGVYLAAALFFGPALGVLKYSDKLVLSFLTLLMSSIGAAIAIDWLPGMKGHVRVALVVMVSVVSQYAWGKTINRPLRDTTDAKSGLKDRQRNVELIVPSAILVSGVAIKLFNRDLFRTISMSGDGRNHAVWVVDLANHGIRIAIERRYPALFNYALTPFVDVCHGREQSATCVAHQMQQVVDLMSASYFLLAALISLAVGKIALQMLHRDKQRSIGLSDALVVIGSALTPLLGVATQSILFDGFLPLYAAIAAVLLAASLANRCLEESQTKLVCIVAGITSLLVLGIFPLLYPAAAVIAFRAMVDERLSKRHQKSRTFVVAAAVCATLLPAMLAICNSQMFERLRSSGSSTNINRAVFVLPVVVLIVMALFPGRFEKRIVVTHLAIFAALVFSAVAVLAANRGSGESTPYYYDKVLIAGISLFVWLPVVAVGGLVSTRVGRFSNGGSLWGKAIASGVIIGTIGVTYVRTEGSSNQLSPIRTLKLGAFSPHPYSIDRIFSEWGSGNRYIFWRFSTAADGLFDPVEDRMLNFWAPLTWHTDTETGAFANSWAYSMSNQYSETFLCSLSQEVDNLRIVTRDKSLAQEFSQTCLNNNDQIELRDSSSTAD